MVKVNCAFDKMVPIHKLVRNPRNPNTHSDEQIRILAKVIDYQGWRNPIVVSTRSGFIVKGHARLSAAEVLQLEEAPVDYQDYDSEAQEWADMLADNRIAELAEIDRTVLKDLIEELDTGAIDLELTGYTDQAIEDLMTAYQPDDVKSELPPAEVLGLDTSNGYFVLLIKTPEDRAYWADFLGLKKVPAGNKIITVAEVKGK